VGYGTTGLAEELHTPEEIGYGAELTDATEEALTGATGDEEETDTTGVEALATTELEVTIVLVETEAELVVLGAAELDQLP